jgi:hypothetical protein
MRCRHPLVLKFSCDLLTAQVLIKHLLLANSLLVYEKYTVQISLMHHTVESFILFFDKIVNHTF